MENLEIRPYRPGDEKAILATFNRVFREVCGEGYVDRTMEEWRWEFQENPRGMRVLLAVTPGGEVAAQYAAVPMAAKSPLGDTTFVHAVDSMVHPDFRKGLKKPGLFVEVGRAWFDYIRELGKDSVGFGSPVRPAWRIGSRYLGYTLVRIVDYLVADLREFRPAPPGEAGLEVEIASSLGKDEADLFWDEWSRGVECAVRRDGVYLDWRYTRKPGGDYRFLLARRGGALKGLALLSPRNELVPGGAVFAEWMVLPGEEGAGRALLAEAREIALQKGRERLLAVLPPWSSEAAFFLDQGFHWVPSKQFLERRLGSYLWKEIMTSEWLAGHWFYTLGDSDLV